MRRGIMIALMNPRSRQQEAEYNDWYERVHVPDVLSLPGFISAVRFGLAEEQLLSDQPPDPAPHKYLTIYEIDLDLVSRARAAMPELAARSEAIVIDAVDAEGSRAWVYERISEEISADPRS